MKVGKAGIELIKRYESLRLTSYQDPGGTYTIGWGATYYQDGTRVKAGQSISNQAAESLLNFGVGVAENTVTRLVKNSLTQSQFDALVSFVFNVGTGNFSQSSLLNKINENPADLETINTAFGLWNKSKGKVYQGLINRRNAEFALYANGTGSSKTNIVIIVIVIFIILILYYFLSK